MFDRIFEIVYNYSLNKKFIGNKAIEEICNIITYNIDFSKVLKRICIYNKIFTFDYAYYDYDEKLININIEKIITNSIEDFKGLLSSESLYLFINLYILKVLFHELNHALQIKYINKKNNDVETILLLYSYFTLNIFLTINSNFKQNTLLYKKTYNYNPAERLAEIDALSCIIKFIDKQQCVNINIKKLFQVQLINTQLLKYKSIFKNIQVPSYLFLSKIGFERVWNSFDFMSDGYENQLKLAMKYYSLEDRLKLGLPISNDEYFSMIKNRKKLF